MSHLGPKQRVSASGFEMVAFLGNSKAQMLRDTIWVCLVCGHPCWVGLMRHQKDTNHFWGLFVGDKPKQKRQAECRNQKSWTVLFWDALSIDHGPVVGNQVLRTGFGPA